MFRISGEGGSKKLFCNTKQHTRTAELTEETIHCRMSGRFVASNIVSGFQGFCFTNEVGVFLSSKQMSLKWEDQTINDTQSCVSTCLLVKGVQTKEIPTLKRKGRKTVSSTMWTPTKSVVVKPPDFEVKGTCFELEKDPGAEMDGSSLESELKVQEEKKNGSRKTEKCSEQDICPQERDGREEGNEGKILLGLLESSLNQKLNPEYIEIIPSRLNRQSEIKSHKLGHLSPRPIIKDEILPKELKFGIRNPKKLISASAFKRPEENRPKIAFSFHKGRLEPLLPREKPAVNLHEELVLEEARARRETRCN